MVKNHIKRSSYTPREKFHHASKTYRVRLDPVKVLGENNCDESESENYLPIRAYVYPLQGLGDFLNHIYMDSFTIITATFSDRGECPSHP